MLNAVEELDGVELSSDSTEDGNAGGSGSFLVADAPPYMKNPNLFPIGNGFGFLIFIKDIID